ncbi:hypothetical protein SI859A1_02148 [Aurantimonas manganoxydans SI85-9A1]|uniref:Curli assembly protein CsgC n=1 Tax=Aurantimonas manganoxydans (strain ATCC BAA-1229 / DSM 21871 / SI85-9A1) TaxID=287752 RepID=Q1YMP8_AURMS|nr:curli-like amyloid fiber formation chaperone CsgH [Aurantimonas manganoxydans]EAS51333.1 hypothetical protein SI859A1_02148 [Aurantimonas manganoxydans SI85-9A1]
MRAAGRHSALLAAGIMLVTGGASRAAEPGAIAAIVVEPTDDGVRMTGRAVALSVLSVDAKMTIERSGSGGRTSTSQGGRFTLEKGESADVATVGLSMAAGDALSVELVLSVDGRTIARSVVETAP